MIDFLFELGLFTAKTVLIVAAILAVVIFIIQASSSRVRTAGTLEIEKINSRLKRLRAHMQSELLDKKQLKAFNKEEKKSEKNKEKNEKASDLPRVFLLDFNGDVKATAVQNLREEITAVLSIARPQDEVVLRLESGGGLVTSYGLAASQLARLKKKNIRLTICVDKIAASGGYMMACVADRIVAAPFAVLGSIGVVAQVPNFHRILKKHDVDYREVTAGEYKRTVSIFGEITDAGLSKFKTQIEETHTLFKSFVSENRPSLDIAKVATGEYWFGTQALQLGLADELMTSDDLVIQKCDSNDVYIVRQHSRKKLSERFSESMSQGLYSLIQKLWTDAENTKFGS